MYINRDGRIILVSKHTVLLQTLSSYDESIYLTTTPSQASSAKSRQPLPPSPNASATSLPTPHRPPPQTPSRHLPITTSSQHTVRSPTLSSHRQRSPPTSSPPTTSCTFSTTARTACSRCPYGTASPSPRCGARTALHRTIYCLRDGRWSYPGSTIRGV